MKANSTNILIENCDFYTGLGIAIGSIGQYGECRCPQLKHHELNN